jgi:hypothetical protein
MGQRLDLQDILEALLGTNKVYFQPPANVQMVYPCIVYKQEDLDTTFADNKPYRLTKRYLVTVIDPDPDSLIPDKVSALSMCTMQRAYPVASLNHYAFVLYF